jgi:hypothetical protein
MLIFPRRYICNYYCNCCFHLFDMLKLYNILIWLSIQKKNIHMVSYLILIQIPTVHKRLWISYFYLFL